MGDWRAQLNYNCSQPYHAFAYGVMYQLGPEHNRVHQPGGSDLGPADMGGYNTGVPSVYYNTAAQDREVESVSPQTSESPKPPGPYTSGQYPGPVMYYREPGEPGSSYLPRQRRALYPMQGNGMKQAKSDMPNNDLEAHVSPDSWSSGSSREGCLPQGEPEENESSPIIGGPQHLTAGLEDETETPLPAPSDTSSTASTAVSVPKGKARISFSESQMNALIQRFNVQRYLTPVEMKNLAAFTGLSYKQVKTWFQNRRMKLRRHQKDSQRVDRYSHNRSSPSCNAALFSNIPPRIPVYPGEALSQYQEPYNQQMRDVVPFKKPPSQNLAYYLAAMGAAGSASYQPWASSPAQSTSVARPQGTNWPMSSAINHYEYNPATYSATTVTIVESTAMNEPSLVGNLAAKDEDPGQLRSPLQMAIAQNHNVFQ